MRIAVRRCACVAVIGGLAATSFAVRPATADDLKLKDGTKISGTIVGFDDNSFKVKTNYGFAVVQKDQVASIVITPAVKTEDAEKKSDASAEKNQASVPAKPAKSDVTATTATSDSPAQPHANAGPAGDSASAAKAASAPAPAAKKTNATAAKITDPSTPKGDAAHGVTPVSGAAPATSAPPAVSASASAAPPIAASPTKPATP